MPSPAINTVQGVSPIASSAHTAPGWPQRHQGATPLLTPPLIQAPMPVFSFQPSSLSQGGDEAGDGESALMLPGEVSTQDAHLQQCADQGGSHSQEPPLLRLNPYLMRYQAAEGYRLSNEENAGDAGGELHNGEEGGGTEVAAFKTVPNRHLSYLPVVSSAALGALPPSHHQQQQRQQLLHSRESFGLHPTSYSPHESSISQHHQPTSSAASSTSDLISKLYSRYNEAQSFLSEMRSSKKSCGQ